MPIHVVKEAQRCLQCKVPRCRTGCPINTSIPEMIRLFRENRLNDAGKMLFENNPLSVVCSLVCDHEKQCEGHCVLGVKGAPVHISSIENYISDTYLDRLEWKREPEKGQKVGIIGSGPAGITIAIILQQRGYGMMIVLVHDRVLCRNYEYCCIVKVDSVRYLESQLFPIFLRIQVDSEYFGDKIVVLNKKS